MTDLDLHFLEWQEIRAQIPFLHSHFFSLLKPKPRVNFNITSKEELEKSSRFRVDSNGDNLEIFTDLLQSEISSGF